MYKKIIGKQFGELFLNECMNEWMKENFKEWFEYRITIPIKTHFTAMQVFYTSVKKQVYKSSRVCIVCTVCTVCVQYAVQSAYCTA